MTGNEKFDNDVGRVNTRLAFLARKHSDQKESMVLSKEKIKQTMEDFLSEHDEKELNVAIYLDSNGRKPICNFHIDTPELETIEDSTKSQLVISDFKTPSLIPDDATIQYKEVARCEPTVKTGETKDDIVADVLEIAFKNGTVLELGFLKI